MGISKQGIINMNGSPNPNIISGTHRANFSTVVTSPEDGIMYVGSGGNGTFSITQEKVPIGNYSYNIIGNTSGNRDFQQMNIPYIANKQYTGSWYAKGSGICLYRSWNRTQSSAVFQKTFTLTNDWQFYYYTFTATQAQQDDNCTFHLGVSGNSEIHICGMKLEEGKVPTLWIPNINDDIYVGSSGFIENNDICKIQKQGYIQSPEFIEI